MMAKLQSFNRFLAVFGKKIWLFWSKNYGKEKSCQSPFSAILRLKKILTATKLEGGGGKALIARPLTLKSLYLKKISPMYL